MRLTLTIDCDNAAFEGGSQEVARILARAAEYFERGIAAESIADGHGLMLRDINGNTVGFVTIAEDCP